MPRPHSGPSHQPQRVNMFNKIAKLPRFWSITLLILFIVLLYVLQQKAITPMVLKVVQEDFFGWFSEKEDEQEELGKISNARSDQAFIQCKNIMLTEKHVPETAQFADKEYEAWALGGRTYLIRSHVNVPSPEKGAVDRKYACKIKYKGGDLGEGKNWDILGVDFNEPN